MFDTVESGSLRVKVMLFFDQRDHELIKIVNIYENQDSLLYTKKTYYPYFHPFGVKELAESKGLRIANSLLHLLSSLERGDETNRLQALRGLRDEILDTTVGAMAKNSARVLLQIMKEIVRARGRYGLQLKLAHDFRKTASGKPRIIRRQLKKYHLLEMPEEWNQATFDDHVHDANTKGRKTPTHLIMDAWIKGIRRLRVIYYHYIEPRFVTELTEAASIMGIEVRIGIEFTARFRDRFISFIWVSRGLEDLPSFLCFLAEPSVIAFMEKGKEVMAYQERYVLKVLEDFNDRLLEKFCLEMGIALSPLEPVEFLRFVAPGQTSILHLAEYIHHLTMEAIKNFLDTTSERGKRSEAELEQIEKMISGMETLTSDDIVSCWLDSSRHPEISSPWVTGDDDADIPERLRLSTESLLEELSRLHLSFRVTLNLNNLKVEDVLELLYAGNGLITRLEIFNLKNYIGGKTDHIPPINELQQAINEGSLLKLKQVVRNILVQIEHAGYSDVEERKMKLKIILHDLATLRNMYKGTPLKSRIGSDSTGRSLKHYGMGLGIIETLPPAARRQIRHPSCNRLIIPVNIKVCLSVISIPVNGGNAAFSRLIQVVQSIPGFEQFGNRKHRKWIVEDAATHMRGEGNIVTLGGIQYKQSFEELPLPCDSNADVPERSWANLNTGVKNTLKVIIGFIPAFTTFVLTKDWWFLAWFGAFIWFGITGLRNIVQSVLGGRGIRRSSLLRWNDYVSWERMTDSLLFTGFSVPLLDYFVKTVLLDHGMNITIASNPGALYSVMALANGIYLSTHNALRGLPRGAIVGNFFRSLFSIPLAVCFSAGIGLFLNAMGIAGVENILQKWAAVISKAASDIMAGLIEGTADRFQNVSLRARDYKKKFTDLFDAYSRLELLFPDEGELTLLENPEKCINSSNGEVRDLVTTIIIDALDMLYFWMYQPRARLTVREMLARFTPEERQIFFLSQGLLRQEQHISRLFVDGILGRKFSKPLSFYLMRYETYLNDLKKLEIEI